MTDPFRLLRDSKDILIVVSPFEGQGITMPKVFLEAVQGNLVNLDQ